MYELKNGWPIAEKNVILQPQFQKMLHEIIISNTTDLVRISSLDILAIKASGNYSVVVLTDGSEQLLTLQLGQVEQIIREQLGGTSTVFIRVGRPVIINLEYLFAISLTKRVLTLKADSGTRVSFDASKEALKALKNYIENKIDHRETHNE